MAAFAAPTDATIIGYSITSTAGTVTAPAPGTPQATYAETPVAGDILLTAAQATSVTFTATPTDADATVEYAYTATEMDPESAFGVALPATLADNSFLWIRVTATNTTTKLIYKIAVHISGETGDTTDDDGAIGGDGVYEAPIIKVTVPLNLDFALDPYEMVDNDRVDDSQIAGVDYKFSNKSNVDVQVDLKFTKAGDAILKSTEDEVNSDAGVATLDAYMAVLAAEGATSNLFAGLNYELDEPGTLFPLLPKENSDPNAVVSFLLAKGVGDGADVVTGTAGIAAFTFYGKLNPYATWETNDLEITANYKLNPIPNSAYEADKAGLKGLNVVPSGSSNPGFIVDGVNVNTYTVPGTISKNNFQKLSIPFDFAGETIDTMTYSGADVKNGAAEAASGDVLEWTPPSANFSGMNGEKVVIITLSGGGTYTLTFTTGN
jgi:hypothetical protein